MSDQKHIFALGGESHTAPGNTIPAYWAALGSGASGLALSVRLTSDGTVVCCDEATLKATCDDPRRVSKVSAAEIRGLDAGVTFRSTILNDNNHASGRGEDTPWSGEGKHPSQWLYHPTLSETLVLFSRRCDLLIFLRPNGKSAEARRDLVNAVAALLVRFGVDRSSVIGGDAETLALVGKALPEVTLALEAGDGEKASAAVATAKKLTAKRILLRAEQFLSTTGTPAAAFVKSLGRGLKVLVSSDIQPFALAPKQLQKIGNAPWLDGFVCRAVHETLDSVRRPCEVLADDFGGKVFNSAVWELGYSKSNKDTKVFQDDGLVIEIQNGGEYSGGAALTTFSIHGDFDARISYHVTNSHQGTTFELAAIQVDPGYREVNLTFDVHGAPPYASSERDEDDGFRIGWNNGPALTNFSPKKLMLKKVGSDYEVTRVHDEAQSSNLYNEYSRDVGYAKKDSPEGELRLVRTGSIFNSYYKDQNNAAWVLSGSALVPTLAGDVFLRLGAKHWPKGGIVPPANTVKFRGFKLFQRRI